MKTLPGTAVPYKRTPEFSDESIPAGLLKAHSTKRGTWGEIVVLEGQLRYRILEPTIEEIVLSAGSRGVIEPGVLHEVSPVGRVRFYVQFYEMKGN